MGSERRRKSKEAGKDATDEKDPVASSNQPTPPPTTPHAPEGGTASAAMQSPFRRNTILLLQKNLLLRKNSLPSTVLSFVVPVAFAAFVITFWTLMRRNPNTYGIGNETRIFGSALNATGVIPADASFYYVAQSTSAGERDLMHLVAASMRPPPKNISWEAVQDDALCSSPNVCFAVVVFTSASNSTGGSWNYTIRMPYGKFLLPDEAAVDKNNGVGSYGTSGFIALQVEIDTAIARFVAKRSQATLLFDADSFVPQNLTVDGIQFTARSEEQATLQLDQVFYTFMLGYGSTILVLVFVGFVFMLVNDLVMEKETKIKEGMMMMGLTNGVYYVSWVLTAILFNLLPWTIVCVVATFTYFPRTHFFLLWILFVLTGLSCISLSFVFIVFFSRARVAGLVSGVVTLLFGAIAPIVQAYAGSGAATLVGGWRYVLSLLSPTALVFGCMVISEWELSGVGVQFSSTAAGVGGVWQEAPLTGNMTFGGILLMIVGDIFLYLALAWYLAQVVPSQFGTTKPFYFLFMPSYWAGEGGKSADGVERIDLQPGSGAPESVVEEADRDLKVGVGINKLVKRFKKQGASGWHYAVDHLTLDIYANQVLSLLGHNGAGKTTTMGMLTGLLPVSDGDALVAGFSIRTQMPLVRRSLGVCPQHDILWDKLTVRQTLRLYAGLKGLPFSQINAAVEAIIADVGMTEKADSYTVALSGGQKRKVCIAIAFIGNSNVVFLDEPTSGMDPFSRRAVWDLIAKMRTGRTIVLTTHFMDEADILGDRIAIMSRGVARCAGSSLFLKSRFGIGYTLTLTKDPKKEVNNLLVDKLVLTIVDGALYGFDSGTEIVYRLPMNSSPQFAELFRELEEVKEDAGISGYGVSVTSLEEVFLRIADDNKLERNAPAEDDLDLGRSEAERSFGITLAKRTPSIQAETLDAWRLERSQSKKNVRAPDAAPVAADQEAGKEKGKRRKHRDKKGATVTTDAPTTATDGPRLNHKPSQPVISRNAPEFVAPAAATPSFSQQLWAMLLKRAWVAMRDWKSSVAQVLIPLLLVMIAVLIGLTYEQDCDFGALDENIPLNLAYGSGPRGTFFPGYQGGFLNESHPDLNYQPQSSLAGITAFLQANDGVNRLNTLGGFGNKGKGSPVLSPKDTRTQFPSYLAVFNTEPPYGATTDFNPPAVINFVHNSILSRAFGLAPGTASKPNTINLQMLLFGDTPTVTPVGKDGNSGFSAFILVLLVGYGYFPAASAAFIIKERVTNAKHQQRVSGASALVYWLSSLLWDLIPALLVVAGTIPLLYVMGTSVGSPTWYSSTAGIVNIGPVVLVLVLYVFACLPHVYCMTFLFESYGAGFGGILGFYVMVGFMHISAFMGLYMSGNTTVAVYVSIPFMLLCPPAGLSKGLMVIGNFVSLSCDGQNNYKDLFTVTQLGLPLIFLAAQVVLFPLVLLVLENLNKIRAWVSSKFTSQESWEGSRDNFEKDEDVKAEEELVISGKLEEDTLVHCKRVRKVYPPNSDGISKIAISNLSFHVRKGECLGLLGPNGAGKTSTFRTVSGDLLPTYGDCFVNGHSLLSDLDGVQRSIGVCPQFDALLDNLTVREHFVLYAHIKGIPRASVSTVVDELIERLDLTIHKSKQTCSLSGGNKRKVSLGCALIGNPPVILLDEPSTGMDPEAKRFMWNVIAGLKSKHAIILTTHSMEEADTLCTRIAIMVDGRMRCLGSPQHLKQRFGMGYNLEFKVKSEGHNSDEKTSQQVTAAIAFIKNAFPSAQLIEQRRAQARFDLPSEEVALADVFEAVESRKEQLGLAEYSISQTTLEQIFLFFGKRQAGLSGKQQQDVVVVAGGGNRMDRILNILFATVGLGFLPAIPKLGFGLLLTLSVIGSPVGMRSIRWAYYGLTPFGRNLDRPAARERVPVWMNVLLGVYCVVWFPLSVLGLLAHMAAALINFVSLIGIPFGIKHAQLAWRGISYMVLGSPVDPDAGSILQLYQYVAGFEPRRHVDRDAPLPKRIFQHATGRAIVEIDLEENEADQQ